MGNAAEWASATVTLGCNTIAGEFTTVIPAVRSGPLKVLAWIVAVPGWTPVTGTMTLVAVGANVTLAGTVATLVSLELRLTVKPPVGVGTVNVRF